jgi:hypothetical protein
MDTFKSFWFGDPLSPYQWLALKSFIDHGHRYVLYSYGRLDVPAGVEVRDAGTILPQARVFFYKWGAGRGSVAGFSNLFRYKLLASQGGWWVDTDVVCLAASVPDADLFLGWQEKDLVGSAILRFPVSHPLVTKLVAHAEDAGSDLTWGQTGPDLVTRLVHESDLAGCVSPAESSYPIGWREAMHVLLPQRTEEVRAKVGAAPFLHLWNEIFRRNVILQWLPPPAGSYLSELCSRHAIRFSCDRTYTADQTERINENWAARFKGNK